MLLLTTLIALLAFKTAVALPVATTYDPEYLTPRTWNKVAEMLPTFKREKDFDSYGRYTVFTFKPGDPWLSKANSGDPKMKGQFLDVGNPGFEGGPYHPYHGNGDMHIPDKLKHRF